MAPLSVATWSLESDGGHATRKLREVAAGGHVAREEERVTLVDLLIGRERRLETNGAKSMGPFGHTKAVLESLGHRSGDRLWLYARIQARGIRWQRSRVFTKILGKGDRTETV